MVASLSTADFSSALASAPEPAYRYLKLVRLGKRSSWNSFCVAHRNSKFSYLKVRILLRRVSFWAILSIVEGDMRVVKKMWTMPYCADYSVW
jgi:hypothetical protein